MAKNCSGLLKAQDRPDEVVRDLEAIGFPFEGRSRFERATGDGGERDS